MVWESIVIGLLIAIGPEHSVEYIHHRHQLQEARRELSKEVDDNRRTIELDIDSTRKASLALDADIAMLRAKRSSSSPVAKKFDYTWEPYDTQDGRWQAAKRWPATGFVGTWFRAIMLNEVGDETTKVQPRVQARSGQAGTGT